ncbi:MAG: hypothetical protein GY765_05515 [bacterium]|nr:hypothetical protein [bacterium]
MDNSKETLSNRILKYLEHNPEAGDTLEGIAEWWLHQIRIEEAVDSVAEALRHLVEKGIINIRESPAGTIYYKIKQQ